MRRLECARPARTATGQARNAGEAVQQLAHIARERQRLGQERKALTRRMHKIDARLGAMTTLEEKLMPMMRQETDRARAALPVPAAPAAPAPATRGVAPATRGPRDADFVSRGAAPTPPVRRPQLPIGLSEQTLQY